MATSIDMGDMIVATSEQVSCDVEGEAAILNLKNGVYYGLNPMGARIWTLIQQPTQFADLRDQLLSEYKVEAARLEADVRQLLADLAEHGLIEVKHWISKFARLPSRRRALLLRVAPLVVMVRWGLWMLPFGRLRRLVARMPPSSNAISGTPAKELVWAVQAASRRIPAATCLTQAIALQKLLRAAGHSSQIEIGVAKTPDRGFQAHAWVECGGATLLSSPVETSAYQRLLTLANDPSRN